MSENKINKKTNGKNKKMNLQKIVEFKMNFNVKNLFIIFFIVFFLFYTFRLVSSEVKKALPEKSITTVVKEIKEAKVNKVEVFDNRIIVYYKNEKMALSYKEASDSFLKTLRDSGVNPEKLNITIKDTQSGNGVINFLSNIIPTILMVAFFVFLYQIPRPSDH